MSSRRRGRGEGSIALRKDGRWMGRIDLGWRDGKRRGKAIYGPTRRAVGDRMAEILRSAQDGTLIQDERQTVARFLNQWLSDVARPRVRPRTLTTYEAAVERHITPHIGRIRLTKLTPQHLQTWFAALEAAGVSPNRRRYARVVLRMALNTAMRWRLVTQNVATLIDSPRVTARGITPFTPEQSRVFLKAVDGHELEGFFTVALACGLRLGESLGLQWSDVDLDGATLQVRRAMQRFGGDAAARRPLLAERKRLLKLLREAQTAKDPEARRAIEDAVAGVRVALRAVKTEIHFVEPKSARSRRTIALPSTVVKSLNRHRVRQLEARLAAGQRWHDSGLVFSTPIGTPHDGRNVTRAFKGILVSQGLPTIRIHDLRHSCATLLLMQGVSPRVVMETLGHSQVSLTLNTYSHVLPALQEDAASKMDAILSRS